MPIIGLLTLLGGQHDSSKSVCPITRPISETTKTSIQQSVHTSPQEASIFRAPNFTCAYPKTDTWTRLTVLALRYPALGLLFATQSQGWIYHKDVGGVRCEEVFVGSFLNMFGLKMWTEWSSFLLARKRSPILAGTSTQHWHALVRSPWCYISL